MAIENGESNDKANERCILVGLRMDSVGHELLNWVLTTLARQGDRVVAVNICRKPDLCKNSTLSLIKDLDNYMAAYDALCSAKQVILVGRVTLGSSIQKVLVKEAKLCAARIVVVGANKNYLFGGSASLAKYCAKKLPSTTAVIAIQNREPIFQTEPTKPLPRGERKPLLRNVLHPSVGMEAKAIIPGPKAKPRKEEISKVDYHVNCENKSKAEGSSSSISVLVDTLQEKRLGWPLLRRVASDLNSSRDSDVQKLSVVQWVMNLPKRSFPSFESHGELPREFKLMIEMNISSCHWFCYEELYNSTNQFSSENLIGNGGTSRVYKGSLPSGQEVAIKLSKLSAESSRDFLLEIEIITKLQHKRIVPLIGICVEGNSLISVYSYLCKGSLEENLHSKQPLAWEMRYKIATGIVEALAYLHTDCSRPVIHRDVKSSNILLTSEFEAQLSDFGLAIWSPQSSDSVIHTDIVGTFGYIAPEYFMYGKVSDKIDVYAFGVVLLELLTGRKPINNTSPKGQESLVMWALPILNQGHITELMDPNLKGKYNELQARRMVLTASLCLARAARLRPQMSQILRLLEADSGTSWNNHQSDSSTDLVFLDEENYPTSSLSSYIGLSLLEVEDDVSTSSIENSNLRSLEEYLRERWSRSSSFD